jgi:hypothetical protein
MTWGKCILGAGLLAASLSAGAVPASSALIYIDQREYDHEIKLWHFYYDYWYAQGPAVEPIALSELKPMFGETGMCEGQKTADVVVLVKPRMFYNPHFTRFYASIQTQVFSGSGRLLGQYKGVGEHHGFLDVVPDQQVRETYALAMQDVVKRMQADAALREALAKGRPEGQVDLSCGMIPLLPPIK